MSLVPVILCGGAGSRLWPVSRELHPKPFIRMADKQSLLQKAFLRGADLPDIAEILTITNRELFFKIEDELREVNTKPLPLSYVLEPFGRNTAAAVASASLFVAERCGPDALMLVLAADHLISDAVAFEQAVSQACKLAETGKIVTFGIKPEAPETGYGYIEAEGNRVLRFVEKPNLETAQQYLATGRYFWNSGMFCFRASDMLSEMRAHCPHILSAVEHCMQQSRKVEALGLVQVQIDGAAFDQVPEDSIDYAVMEKSAHVAVVACDIGWSDIGSWSAISELHEQDAFGNRVDGEALLHDVTNTFVRGGERMIGAVGVDNLIIIDTPDALLVADRRRAQDVKHLYAQLKMQGHDTHKSHRTVHRPWGSYTVLEEGSQYKIKRIEVKPGASLSLQLHHHRSEHWIVVSGAAKIVNGSTEMLLTSNQSSYIQAGHPHRLSNPGVLPLILIEVQSGEYLGEDDIIRLQDHYGRV